MTRLLLVSTVVLGACAVNLGGPSPIDVPTAAIRADADASAAAVGSALRDAGVRAAFLTADRDDGWFTEVAGAADLTLSGPAPMNGLRLAFLGPEPLGDTTLTLRYDDGRLPIHDALYEIEDDRLLDLLAFRVEDAASVRPAMGALLEYVATDVNNSAALVLAAVVPSGAAGDSIARMLSPAYYDALRCEGGTPPATDRDGIRLFYGPEARMYCNDATAGEIEVGDWVRAQLVMGRR